ncbi:flagellar biosynthetic protein FliO, partial [Cellulomonas biazotea]
MDSVMLLLRVVLSLAVVVGLVWWVGRRWGAGRAAGGTKSREPQVQVVGRQAVGRHAGVAVVAVGSRRLLVGYGEQQVTFLTELAPVVEVQPAPPAAAPRPAPAAKPVVVPGVPRPHAGGESRP